MSYLPALLAGLMAPAAPQLDTFQRVHLVALQAPPRSGRGTAAARRAAAKRRNVIRNRRAHRG